jgi:AsmA protein
MSRLSKVVVWVIAAVVALFAVAAIAVFLFFDPSDFRDDIAEAVKKSTGRDLVIDGDVSLQVFPWLAVEVGHAALGNAPGFGDEAFAEFDRAQLSVRLMPLLLRREVTVGTAVLDALRLNLAVDSNGRSNWDDLVPEEDGEVAPAEQADGKGLDISGVDINDAAITYVDRANGDTYTLSKVNMRVGRISDAREPVPASGSLHFDMQPAAISGDIEVETVIAFDSDTGIVALDGLALGGVAEGLVDAPTRFSFETAGVEVRTEDQVISMQPVAITALDIDISAELQPFSYAGSIEPTAAIQVDAFSPRSLMHLFEIEPPETADPVALSSMIISASADIRENAVALTAVNMKLDDTTFKGSLTVPRNAAGRYTFNLDADAINLNRYMAPPVEASDASDAETAPVEIPVELIKPLNAGGELRVAAVTLGNLELEQVALGLNSGNGRMRMHPITAGLFGGHYNGDVRIDVSGVKPVLSLDENVQGVDLAKLAQAMFEQENITGSIAGNFRLTGRGNDMAEIQKTLDGSMSFELKDGTYEGMDVWYELRRARALIKQETPPEPVLPARTKFSSVTASGTVKDGVMRNDDLMAELPFMQLTGRGNVDVAAGTVNYDLRARVYDKPEAMAGATPEEIDDLTKAVIPLKITGPLTSPKVVPDVEALLRERVEDEIKDMLKDKLKDLFDQ